MISTISRTIEAGVKNSPAPCPSASANLREEVLVDQAEGVALEVLRVAVDVAQQRRDRGVVDRRVGLRQDAGELGVVLLDRAHRVVDGLAEVRALGQARAGARSAPARGGRGRAGRGSRTARSSAAPTPLPRFRRCAASNLASAKRRKISPSTGVPYSEALSPEFARSSSAASPSRVFSSARSGCTRVPARPDCIATSLPRRRMEAAGGQTPAIPLQMRTAAARSPQDCEAPGRRAIIPDSDASTRARARRTTSATKVEHDRAPTIATTTLTRQHRRTTLLLPHHTPPFHYARPVPPVSSSSPPVLSCATPLRLPPPAPPPASCLGRPAIPTGRSRKGVHAKRWTPFLESPGVTRLLDRWRGGGLFVLLKRTTRDEHLETNTQTRTGAVAPGAGPRGLRGRPRSRLAAL